MLNNMKRDHHEYEKSYIGSSDYAALTATGCGEHGVKSEIIRFNQDDDYDAYICDEQVEIPEHYERVAEFKHWVRIYDDAGLTKKLSADKIEIFRAAQMGCIIKLTGAK